MPSLLWRSLATVAFLFLLDDPANELFLRPLQSSPGAFKSSVTSSDAKGYRATEHALSLIDTTSSVKMTW
jgi:hypothetical protein